jgi:hypothetical protein
MIKSGLAGPFSPHGTVDRTSNSRKVVKAVKAVGTVEEASGDRGTVTINLVHAQKRQGE